MNGRHSFFSFSFFFFFLYFFFFFFGDGREGRRRRRRRRRRRSLARSRLRLSRAPLSAQTLRERGWEFFSVYRWKRGERLSESGKRKKLFDLSRQSSFFDGWMIGWSAA